MKTKFVGQNKPDMSQPWRVMVRQVDGMGLIQVIVQGNNVWILRPDNVWDVMMPQAWSDGETVMEIGA